MNKFLIMIALSILAITSYADTFIVTNICNITNDDIVLYKPLSASDYPTYANKDNNSWYPLKVFGGEEYHTNAAFLNSIRIPHTTDCYSGTTTITVYDNNGGGGVDYMTLCSSKDTVDCAHTAYSLQFYNPAMDNSGVVPGYMYKSSSSADSELCGKQFVDQDPCRPYSEREKTACDRGEAKDVGTVYKCSILLMPY